MSAFIGHTPSPSPTTTQQLPKTWRRQVPLDQYVPPPRGSSNGKYFVAETPPPRRGSR